MTLKKNNPSDQKGFVLAEFVIALPLLILLLFALGQMTFKIFSIAKVQAADYVLEIEAQEILERISADAKSAHSVEIKQAIGGKDIQEIFFNYHVVGNGLTPKKDFFQNPGVDESEILDLIYTHRFTAGSTSKGGPYIYAERIKNGAKTNPISGGNFFGDTTVTRLNFSQPKENILHIEIEMQSTVTSKKFKAGTSVFMSACEKVEIHL